MSFPIRGWAWPLVRLPPLFLSLLLAALGLAPQPAVAGSTLTVTTGTARAQKKKDGPPSAPKLLIDDLDYVLHSPERLGWKGWASTAVVAGGLAVLMKNERGDVDHEPSSEGTTVARDVAKAFEPLGAEGSLGVLGAFWLAGAIGHDQRAHDVAVDGAIASVIAAGVVTPFLKESVGRSRPHQSASGTDFHPFSGKASFPSGHTTQAFALASVISSEYDSRWVSVAAYGSAALVGYARVLHDRHYVSDVIAGALVGTLVGRAVAAHNRKLRGFDLSLGPVVAPQGGVGFGVRFDFP